MSQIYAQLKIYVRQLKDEFKKSDGQHKALIILMALLSVVLVFFLIGGILGLLFWLAAPRKLKDAHSFLYYGCGNAFGWLISGMFTFIVFRFIWKVGTPNDLRIETTEQNEDGVTRPDKGIDGTAYRMKKDEATDEFEVCPMDQSINTTFGSFDQEGTESVHIKPSPYGGELRNILLCGPSGSQKSRCFNRNEIANSCLRGESACYADPSMELYTEYNLWCRKHGAKVYFINFKDPERSDGWNCLKETVNENTERIDPSLLNRFSSVFINNVDKGKTDGNPYWYEQANNYFKAAVGYCAWKHEDTIVKFLKRLYLKVSNDPNKNEMASLFKGLVSIKWCKQQVYAAGASNGYEKATLAKAIERIEKYAPPFTMEDVVKALKDFDMIETAYNKKDTDPGFIPVEQVGKDAYRTVTKEGQSETAKTSGIISTLGKLSLFTDPMLTYNLSRDGINLNNINKEQTIVFVGMPDTDTTLEPITSLFFTFLFIDTQRTWDREQAIATEKKIKNPLLDVNIVLDDFFSIGVVGGDPKLYTTYMSNARKRHLFITMIIQDISQLKTRYGEENANTIISNCRYQVCFGASDLPTMEYFSKICGITTAIKVTERRTDGFIPTRDPEMSVTTQERNLYNPDEVWNLPEDQCIVIKSHQRPLQLYKISYEKNPVFINGELDETQSVYTTIPSYYEKIAKEMKDKERAKDDNAMNDYIENIQPSFTVDEDGVVKMYSFNEVSKRVDKSVKGVSLSGQRPKKEEQVVKPVVKEKSAQENEPTPVKSEETPKAKSGSNAQKEPKKQSIMNNSPLQNAKRKSAFNR